MGLNKPVCVIPRMRGWSVKFVDAHNQERDKFFSSFDDAHTFAKFLSNNVTVIGDHVPNTQIPQQVLDR